MTLCHHVHGNVAVQQLCVDARNLRVDLREHCPHIFYSLFLRCRSVPRHRPLNILKTTVKIYILPNTIPFNRLLDEGVGANCVIIGAEP